MKHWQRYEYCHNTNTHT